MNELNRIPSPSRVQSLSGQGGARDGKPHLERRRRRKKKGEAEEGKEAEAQEGQEAAKPETDAAGKDEEDPDDEERGRHVDVRA
ncbi:MAG: hypothetical protein R3E97_09470 [Candidatus Eisenbacteria bacterium]